MAKRFVSSSTGRSLEQVSAGPKLVGVGLALFVVTRIVRWLPLGFVGSWINGLLWPVLILCVAVGAGLIYLKTKRGR